MGKPLFIVCGGGQVEEIFLTKFHRSAAVSHHGSSIFHFAAIVRDGSSLTQFSVGEFNGSNSFVRSKNLPYVLKN